MNIEKYLENVVTWISTRGLDLLIALVLAWLIFVIGKFIAKKLSLLVEKAVNKKQEDAALANFAKNVTYFALVIVVTIAALGKLGVETTSLAVVLGSAGLAIGLSLKDSLSNFAAGIMILLLRPFRLGDFIEVAGTAGVAHKIEILTTQLLSGDNKLIVIPNSAVMAGNMTNYSANDTRRVDLVFGIGYGDSIDKAKEVIERVVKANTSVLAEPATTIAVSELADSSVNFVVRPWVKTADYWAVNFALNEAIKKEFDKEGISIPYPQQEVHMHQISK